MNSVYYFHHGWRFRLAGRFPIPDALEDARDAQGRTVTDPDYPDDAWEKVALPHTFNDGDLFSVPIEDSGSAQRRTAAFYRNTLTVPPEHRGKRAFLLFEGLRQSCHLYVNGRPAGLYEAGVGPFGFDLTPFLLPGGAPQCIAVVTENTGTRNIPFCGAETPNRPDAVPGSYLCSQDQPAPGPEGVVYSWNCNDFNPVLGGISQPLRLCFKPDLHLTLPCYANLQSRGSYVFAEDFDFFAGAATVRVEAEIRNQRKTPASCAVQVRIESMDGEVLADFASEAETVLPSPDFQAPFSLVPEDAYRWDPAAGQYVPDEAAQSRPTDTQSPGTSVLRASGKVSGLRFWGPSDPALYRVRILLTESGAPVDEEVIETGFRHVSYDPDRGLLLNGRPVWLRGYAQRATNEWAASGIVPEWMKDLDARWIRESHANHIRWMHVAASPADIRAADRAGILCTQPAGDKERETFGRQWRQRVELMRNVLISCRNHPSILFWEAGNNVISAAHMREMRLLKEELDPHGGRFMGCRTIHTDETLRESEYAGTMLNRHAARFLAEHGPVTETEYSREEAPRRLWDDFTPPDYGFPGRYVGRSGRKQKGLDFYDLTAETLALANARGYAEFFHDRIGGASGRNLYSACAALCWTDSAQHGRQSWSENGRMSGRVDAIRVKKQSFDVFRVIHSTLPEVRILGHWNYPPLSPDSYLAPVRRFNGVWWEETGEKEQRDPRNKTVYCVASYPVFAVELRVNGRSVGRAEKPVHGFIFPFPGVDVTRSGFAEAFGLDASGHVLCRDRVETAGPPDRIRLQVRTAPGGWRADGQDLAMVDLEITDTAGRVCPLCDLRLSLKAEGNAVLLGGYNSGRFEGNGRHDNVIHKPVLYAECGRNRILLRSTETPGEVRLSVSGEGIRGETVLLRTVAAGTDSLTDQEPAVLRGLPASLRDPRQDAFSPNPELDRRKYEPEAEDYCKILVNGQEPDFRGVRAVNRNGSIWGNILCVLERIRAQAPQRLDYSWDPVSGELSLCTGEHLLRARVGETHLTVDGRENLMDGAPYRTPEGILVMEAGALLPWIEGASVQYDARLRALMVSL